MAAAVVPPQRVVKTNFAIGVIVHTSRSVDAREFIYSHFLLVDHHLRALLAVLVDILDQRLRNAEQLRMHNVVDSKGQIPVCHQRWVEWRGVE
jgi:hypothetical protein